MNGETHPASVPDKDTVTRPLYYAALAATLVVALLYVYSGMRGHPMKWPQTAFLIALCCVSVNGFMTSKVVKMLLGVAGLVFAIVSVYGFVAK